MMKLKDFIYELPERLIAQSPAERRTGSRLMVIDREKQQILHRSFEALKDYLVCGDCLVFNDTKVMPARLIGKKISTSSDNEPQLDAPAAIEVLLIRKAEDSGTAAWEAMVRPGKRLKQGARISFGNGALEAQITAVLPDGNRLVQFNCRDEDFPALLSQIGQVPLPPYITNKEVDITRYQTVYARNMGSAAAPTAGLHFSKDYIDILTKMGIKSAYLTLHVGPGTFKPVKTENIEEHHMHREFYHVSELAADTINAVKATRFANQGMTINQYQMACTVETANTSEAVNTGGTVNAAASVRPRVISVGTTSLRTLESVADKNGFIKPCDGSTEIFIYPGYTFRCIDALLTNFHLPGSTLLMLVSAFAGHELVMEAYRQAVANEYRFFSFGDAMLLI